MNETETLLLKVEEARKLLRIGRPLIYRLIREGKIPSVRLGRLLFVPKEALRRTFENPKEVER